MSEQISSLSGCSFEEGRLETKKLILSSFLELRTQDGVIPPALIKAHLGSPEDFLQIVEEMKSERLVDIVKTYDDEPGLKLTLKSALSLIYGDWPWE